MEGKESYILYANYHEQIKLLSNEQAGILFKTIDLYVNDLNPEEPQDPLINIVWMRIKKDLKSDLKRWKEQCSKNRENVLKRWNKPNTKESESKQSNTSEYERIQDIRAYTNYTDTDKEHDREHEHDKEHEHDNITDLTDYSNINYNNTARTRDIKDPINFDEGYYHIVKMLQDNLFIEKNDRYQEESFRQAVKWLNDKFTFNDIYSLTRIFLINYLNNDEIDSGSNEILNKPAYYYTSILDLSKKLNKGGENEKLNNC